ncbi:MAG: AAA family ATPase [Bacteroidales bacterium]
MKLIAFRIQNFRSVIDSGLNFLSGDNISVLIGQNESGKTSILEGIYSFYTGDITDDMLRSDLSMPVVTCLFSLDKKEDDVQQFFLGLPSEVAEVVKNEMQLELTRFWNPDKTSYIRLGGEKLDKVYEQHITRFKLELEEIRIAAEAILREEREMGARLISLKKELDKERKKQEQLAKRINDLQMSAGKANDNARKEKINVELDRSAMEKSQLMLHISTIEKQLNEFQPQHKQLSEKSFYARTFTETIEKFENARKQMGLASDSWKQLKNKLALTTLPRELKELLPKVDQAQAKISSLQPPLTMARQELVYSTKLLRNIIMGMPTDQARAESARDTTILMELGTPEEAAYHCMKMLPNFEFFEDFSSLLPNRIDLEDLLMENTHAEGYKAVRNLLIIAGVDASFFGQQNNRILKQKIENLNGELSVNFQDYWSQNVGRNNKIRIQFELEHYDITHPEKKGKPYLEFWIKDERERLYPKQRSRGVRWFLSFYLEVKATAKTSKARRIMLIDEPGLSLHARAQEDVLKVFEDLKDELMIIYSTHSPHLIDTNKIYRILAVQRAIEEDEASESIVIDAKSLARASADTLSPIYSLMGSRVTDHEFIQKKNNIIVENIAEYYYMNAFFRLLDVAEQVAFLPANGPAGVPVLANLLMGWKLDFIVLSNDNDEGNIIRNELKINLCGNDDHLASRKLLSVENNRCVVDLFTTIDFKNHILQKRTGITETNSEYISLNDLSGTMLAMDFYNRVAERKVKWTDLDEETQNQVSDLVKRIMVNLK